MSFANLVLALAIFFNIERLDFGQENLVDVQTFVYLLGTAAVLSLLLVPGLARRPVWVWLGWWLGVYGLCKFFVFNGRPVLGGVYTYLSMSEAGLIAALVVLAQRTGGGLEDFAAAVRCITLEKLGEQVAAVEAAGEVVRAEMTRSRHYQRPLSVIVAAPEPEGVEVVLPVLVREAERALGRRYARVRLAALIRKQVRLMDTVLEDRSKGRFIILCPEMNGQHSTILIERIRTAVSQELGVEVRCASASFPETALTFEELVSRAELELERGAKGKATLNEARLYGQAQG